MNTKDFDYNLPIELIAQIPLQQRDASRLLVYNRANMIIKHSHFFDLKMFLKKGDVLVVNNTKVLPARLYGHKQTGAKIEILLHKRLSVYEWEVLVKPSKRLKEGCVITFGEQLQANLINKNVDGSCNMRFIYDGIFEEVIAKIGSMPLPHYIKEVLHDKDRYQTVYKDKGESSAAPTAGLHFTQGLLDELKAIGVTIVDINLNVGLGTFRPVQIEELDKHIMHSEYYEIPENTANVINNAKLQNRRIIAVGTTSVRAIESATDSEGVVQAIKNDTNIFIYPPYTFKTITGLITNFHLPKSTLIMLVSAFTGRDIVLDLYQEAIKNKYRFFSFGDAMLIL